MVKTRLESDLRLIYDVIYEWSLKGVASYKKLSLLNVTNMFLSFYQKDQFNELKPVSR